MNKDLEVVSTIEINADAAKVWRGLTTPELIKEYLYGTETVTTWAVGSEVVFQGEYEGHKYRDHGTVLENIPNKKLAYSYWSGFSGTEDKPENYSTITYTIEPVSLHKTNFTWAQKGFATEQGYEHSKNGMAAFMQKLKEVIEK